MFSIIKTAIGLIVIFTIADIIGNIHAASPTYIDDTTCDDIASPYYIQMIPSYDTVIITWTPPQVSGDCSIEFEIFFYINDDLIMKDTTKSTYYIFNEGLVSCSTFRTEIRTVSSSGFNSNFTSAEIDTGIDEISSITVDGNIVSWSMRSGPTKCMFQIEIDAVVVVDNLNELSYNVGSLNPCKIYEITVTPINLNGEFGTSYRTLHEPDVGSPYYVQIIQTDSDVVIAWAPPQITEDCTIEYEISFYINDLFLMTDTTPSTYYIFNEPLSCSLLRIEIRTLSSSGSKSAMISTELYTKPPIIENFRVIEEPGTGTINALWNALGGQCSIRITITRDGATNTFLTAESSGSFVLDSDYFDYCIPYSVEGQFVSTVSDDIGDASSDVFERIPPPVRDFNVQEDPSGTISLSWIPLEGNCRIMISIYDSDGTRVGIGEKEASSGLMDFDNNFSDYCSEYIIEAQFLSSSNSSHSSEITLYSFYKLPTGVQDLQIAEELTGSVVVKWTALAGSCNIVIRIFDRDVIVLEVGADASMATYYFDDSDFDYCITYRLEAQFSMGYDYVGDMTSETFDKIPTGVQNFEIAEESTGSIVIMWTALAGSCNIVIRIFHRDVIVYDAVADASIGIYDFYGNDFEYCITYTFEVQFSTVYGVVGDMTSETFDKIPWMLDMFYVEEHNGIITAMWPPLAGECEIVISVHRDGYDPELVAVVAANMGSYEFLEDDFSYCISYEIQARFSHSPEDSTLTFESFERLPTMLEMFYIEEHYGTMIVRWAPLTGECEIVISIQHDGYDPELVAVVAANMGSYEFLVGDLGYCMSHEIQARFSHSSEDSILAVDTFERIPTMLEMFYIEEHYGTMIVRWAPLTGECEIVISIQHDGYDPELVAIVAANMGSYEFLVDDLGYCISHEIQARFSHSPEDSIHAVDTFERIPMAIEAFYIEEIDGSVAATWTPLAGQCEIIITKYDGEHIPELLAVVAASEGFYQFMDDAFTYCVLYEIQVRFSYMMENDILISVTLDRRDCFKAVVEFQPISAMDIALVDRIVKISWTSNNSNVSESMFEGEFQLECSSGNTDGYTETTNDKSHQFTNCPISENVEKFSMKITPILKDGVIETSSIYCEYKVHGDISELNLENIPGYSTVCPVSSTSTAI